MVSVAVVAGCIWAAVPGTLRAYLNVNETVVSLMLNYMASFLLLYLIHGIWQDPATPGWPQGEPLPESARLSPLIAGTRINLLLPIAVMACLLTGLLLHFSVVGPTWRILAQNPKTARMLAISPSKHILIAFCVGGSLAAIAGFAELTAINLRLREGISLNYGYAGLLVSWIARHNPFVIPIVAFAMAGVITGADALQINAGLPLSTVQILIGLLLFGTLLAEAVYKRTNAQWLEARHHAN
jgi:simple sugar transport system permease protein